MIYNTKAIALAGSVPDEPKKELPVHLKLLYMHVALKQLCDIVDKEYADEDGFVTYGLVSTKRIRDILEKF